MDKKAFCIKCSHKVEYSIASERVEMTVRGVHFSYVEFSAICKECGDEVYVAEINDINHERREEEYRKAARIISIVEIQEILDKYNISAGPLAKLLRFGDVTVNRYLSGQLPSREHSEKLLKVKHSRKLMEELLEKEKDRISPVAYAKCREKLNYLNELYGKDKIELIARYIIAKSGDITALALQKLLYYAQAFYYALYNKNLFNDDCQAWALGPVFPDIYYKYKDYGYDPISNPIDECEDEFNELTTKEITLLKAIMCSFGCYSGKILSAMTHIERPWIEARGPLQPTDRSIATIEREVINSYFSDVVKAYNIVNPCDIINYSKEMYEKINNVC